MLNIQYYSHICKCGCGDKIEIKEYHKWYGIPLYIHGHNKGNSGKHHSDEIKQKMREAKKDYISWNKGKKLTEEHKERIKIGKMGQKRSEEAKLKTSKSLKENYKNGKMISWNKGKPCLEETKQKIKETFNKKGINKGKNNPMYGKYGELAPNWQGGKSFEPYSSDFNKNLKIQVLKRDIYVCQNINCMNICYLDIHHIDYDKKNNNIENLITLCDNCHGKTHFNKQFWMEFYQNIMNLYL